MKNILLPSFLLFFCLFFYSSVIKADSNTENLFFLADDCEPATLPYYEDFESITPPDLPDCTQIENAGNGNNWDTHLRTSNGFNSHVLRYSYHSNNAGNAWFFTRGVQLEANTVYQIKFKYANGATFFPENLKVSFGTSAQASAMNTELADFPDITSGQATTAEINFTVNADDVYYFGFHAYSAANMFELYVDDIEIDEGPDCPQPTSLNYSNVTASSVQLNWNPASNNTSWEVVYGPEGFDPETQGLSESADSSQLTLSNLDDNTTYQAYVRAECDFGISDFSNMITFHTPCAAVDLPFIEDFENITPPAIPECAKTENAGSGNNWQTAFINSNGFDSNVLRYNFSFSDANAWYFTRGINLQAGTVYSIKYKYGNSLQESLYVEKLQVSYGTSANSDAMSGMIANHPNITGGQAQTNEVNFSVVADGVYYFGFNVYSQSGQSSLFVDDIEIEIKPDCPQPTDLALGNLTENSANLSWSAGENENEWEIIFGEEGFDPESEGTTETTSGNASFQLQNLNPNTNYEVYVRAVCGENDLSELSGPLKFLTLCGNSTATVPYLQNFEQLTPPELPNCAQIQNLGDGNVWKTAQVNSNGFNSKVLEYSSDGNHPAQVWFFTQGIELEAGTDYRIKYKYGNDFGSLTQKLKVAYGTSAQAVDMINELADHPEINQAQAQNNEVFFSVDNDDVYYFGFFAYANANEGSLFVDDIRIELQPDCMEPSDLILNYATPDGAEVEWTPAGDETQWEISYGETGFDPENGTIELVDDNPQFIITGLNVDTDYEVYVRAICADGESIFTGPVAFYTGYCSYTQVSNSTRFIKNFSTQGGEENISNLNSGYSPGGYQDATDMVVSQYPGASVNFSVTVEGGSQGFNIYVDWNNDLTFDESEKVYASNGYIIEESGSFIVPEGVPAGNYRMRIVSNWLSIDPSPCGVNTNGGEAEDYTFNVFDVPDCFKPTEITLHTISEEEAQISWIPGGEETQWELRYGLQGFDRETEGIVETVSQNPEFILEDLLPNTAYDIYVKAICDEDESTFTEVFNLKTACEPTTIPFVEDFEGVTIPEIPECGRQENLGEGNWWATANETYYGFDSKVLKYSNSDKNAEVWYFTRGIELEADTNYHILYTYGNNANTFSEKLKVAYGEAPVASAMTEELADHPNVVGAQATTNMVVFTVPADGVYYFGFLAYSDSNQFYLYVDDIMIDIGPTCIQPEQLSLEYLSNTTADFSWISGADESSWEVVYGEPGFDPEDEDNISATDQNYISLTDLESETSYEIYVRAVCSEDDKSEWTGPVAFTTLAEPPVNNFLCTAIELIPDTECQQAFTNVHAFSEINEPGGSCLNVFQGDNSVWFKFEATATQMTITTDFPQTNFDAEVVVFEQPSACEDLSTLGNEVGCANFMNELHLENLTIGQTYFIQITGFNNSEGDFCIEVQSDMKVEKNHFQTFNFYPNPVENILFMKADSQIEKVEVFNLLGQQVIGEKPHSLEFELNTERLDSGLYLMKVHINGVEKSFQILKK